MAWIREVSTLFGCIISLGTLMTVTLPGMRKRLIAFLLHRDEQGEKLDQMHTLLEALVEENALRKKELELQREVDLCVLRDLITTIYYSYAKEKKIPVYAMEDVTALYALYQKRGGNSYVQMLVEQMVEEWEVIA